MKLKSIWHIAFISCMGVMISKSASAQGVDSSKIDNTKHCVYKNELYSEGSEVNIDKDKKIICKREPGEVFSQDSRPLRFEKQ